MVSHRIINNNALASMMFSEGLQGFHLLFHIKDTRIVSCYLTDHTEPLKITLTQVLFI